MKKVKDILAKKNPELISIGPSAKIIEALQLMNDRNIGSVVVLDQGKYLGLITERDYARKVILLGKSSSDTPVSEVMSTELPEVQVETTVELCMILMSEKQVRYLPVMDGKRFVQVISIIDLISATIQDQLETIDYLKTYIQT